ncbi:MAG: UvrD-helicase domain-containing protein [Melioribacteraceae bacterium]|nr:UvrD-helicase domain-containing protein [Melioribacteraceae bacterium]
MPNLTPYQKEALNHSKHISLTANAGSGKTFVLARRFLSILLEENISLTNIVAITFTEKAASELYKKIADELESRIETVTNKGDEYKLIKLRRELVSAKISTIHSFCTEILKEFPTEAKIDANFIPIDQRVSNDLIVASIDEIISNSLRTEDDFTKYIKSNIRLFGSSDTFKKILKRMINERSTLLYLNSSLYQNDVGQIAKAIADKFSKYFEEIFTERTNEVIVAIYEINERVKSIQKDNEIAEKVSMMLADLDFGKRLVNSVNEMHELFSFQLTAKGEVRTVRYLTKKIREGLHVEIESIEEFYKEFKILKFTGEYKKAELELAKFGKEILIVWDLVLKRYTQKKYQKGYLDFEDLLLYSEKIIKRDDVKTYLSERYEYFMIDEYQDTNETQYNIFIPILDYLKRGNLFIVGDEKQSIYMFRGADLRIFNKTKEIIRSTNNDEGLLQLPHSFRLSPKLTLFTNKVFRELFSNPKLLFNEVEYSELICARGNSDEGEIAFLLDDGLDESDSENELVVKKILELVSKGKAEYKDIAILARKKKSFTELETDLLKLDIPYRIYGGKGFYQQQEIYDIYNYLLFLINPNSDESLAAILRSPFFMVSDRKLFEISKENGDSFWDKFVKHSESKPEIKVIVEQLRSDIQKSKSSEISLLIRNILTESGYFAKTKAKRNGNQILANIDKLISTSISFMNKGSVTLYDFVIYLKEFIHKTEDESQAAIGSDENVVKLMTIHASKGLEFPVVFLIDTNSMGMKDQIKAKSVSIDKEFGILTKLPIDNYFEEYVSAPIVGIYNFISEKKSIAESKRLLYVAVTRAENYLYISATAKRKADDSLSVQKDSFLSLFQKSLQMEDFNNTQTIAENITFMLEVNDEFVKSGELVSLTVPVINCLEEEENSETNTSEKMKVEYDIQISSISDLPKNEIISATKISVFNQCPLKYHLIYDLGYTALYYDGKEKDESFDFTREESEGSNSSIPANVKGNIVHQILEEDVPHEKLNDRIEELLDTIHDKLSDVDLENTKNIIFDLIANYYASEIYGKLKEYKTFYNEYEIYLKQNDFYLYGIIDKLIIDGDMAIIIDYKTDSLQKYSPSEKLENYKYQLLFYSFLVSKLNPKIKRIKSMLLFIEDPNQEAFIDVTHEMLQKFETEMLDGIKLMRVEKYNNEKSHCKSCYFSDDKNNCVVK